MPRTAALSVILATALSASLVLGVATTAVAADLSLRPAVHVKHRKTVILERRLWAARDYDGTAVVRRPFGPSSPSVGRPPSFTPNTSWCRRPAPAEPLPRWRAGAADPSEKLAARGDAALPDHVWALPDILRMLTGSREGAIQPQISAVDRLSFLYALLFQQQRSECMTRGLHPPPRFVIG